MSESNGREKLLTLKQVAARFQVSPSTVSYWVKNRMIRFIKMPSGIPRIKESVVEEYLKECGK
jgi:excisionase family DNA binding protein